MKQVRGIQASAAASDNGGSIAVDTVLIDRFGADRMMDLQVTTGDVRSTVCPVPPTVVTKRSVNEFLPIWVSFELLAPRQRVYRSDPSG